ncbi:MAG: polysaccharide deacetylase family protein [Prolixibacteraceae bacterium]|nr:polysaccharide deacetylase family protein [Burkholderiales bacterium]
MLIHGPIEGQSLYLTFDDGPDAVWTPIILDILEAAGAMATFFVIGKQARSIPSLLRRIAAAGHSIGNHTWSHRHPWTMSPHGARREVSDGTAAISDVLGFPPDFFRPPHGRVRRCMLEEATNAGQNVVLWSLSAVDWGPLGRADRIAHRLGKAQPGDIVLMHDGGHNKPAQLVSVLPAFLASMQSSGLNIRSLWGALPSLAPH